MKRDYEIVKFEKKHAADARELARQCYLEECGHVHELPKDAPIPDPVRYDNGLGVVAYHDNKMVGFLCCIEPFEGFFGTSRGTYVPINAHGAAKEDRRRIYSRLYEAAAELWVKKGILSHVISIYSHDNDAIDSFFQNGFGMRTIDAIRGLNEILTQNTDDMTYRELAADEYHEINPLRNRLISHLNSSPMFMPHRQVSTDGFEKEIKRSPRRYFTACEGEKIIAYIKVTDSGESFVGDQPQMANIQGAFMEEKFRGSGIYTKLLSYVIKQLKNDGYSLLGVDCESFNPTARNFWLKHFTPYIYGLTRRIDERIVAFYE